MFLFFANMASIILFHKMKCSVFLFVRDKLLAQSEFICFGLVVRVLWHINLSRLSNAKSFLYK